ncbi:MAG: 1-phosphofructokinase [Vulcanimicrobiaceae bacterium]
MVRIATVSLNPAIDQTANVPNFAAGAVNRVQHEQSDAGGKGVNVASFLAHTGHAVAVTGLLGRDNAGLFERLFVENRILDRFVRLPGSTRVNVKIVDEVQDRVTDINFPGLLPTVGDLAALTAAVDALAETAEWFVLSGSVPAGVPNDIYAALTARLKQRRRTVLLDASGPPFAAAIDSGPDVIKPNIDELEELLGRRLESEAAIVGSARSLIERGVGLVAVSMGARGAVFVEAGAAVVAVPPKAVVKSTVGAGDAMVAGLIAGKLQGLELGECARLATAYSLGALGEIGPRLPAPEILRTFAPAVSIRHLDFAQHGAGEQRSPAR